MCKNTGALQKYPQQEWSGLDYELWRERKRAMECINVTCFKQSECSGRKSSFVIVEACVTLNWSNWDSLWSWHNNECNFCLFSGAMTLCITNPIWVTKTRLVLQYNAGVDPSKRQYRGMFDALIKIYKTEGVRGLYKVITFKKNSRIVWRHPVAWWDFWIFTKYFTKKNL